MAEKRKIIQEEKASTSSAGTFDVVGYVHEVSQIKKGRKTGGDYFNMTLQTGKKEFHHSVCFTPEKRKTAEAIAKAKSPLKITTVDKTISFSDPGNYDIKLNKLSTMEHVAQLNFSYKEPIEAGVIPINDVISNGVPGQNIVINSKVIKVNQMEEKTGKTGEKLNLYQYCVADESALIRACSWSDHNLLLDKCYKIKGIIREYNNVKSIIMSTVQEIEDLDIVDCSPPEDIDITVACKFIAANISLSYFCNACNKTIMPDLIRNSVKCLNCNLRQRNSSLKKVLSGKVKIEGDSSFYHLTTEVMREFLQSLQTNITDQDDIEELLLEDRDFKLRFVNSQIKKIEQVDI